MICQNTQVQLLFLDNLNVGKTAFKWSKNVALTFLCVFAMFNLNAQQTPVYSQYMLNQYIINPAYTGLNNYFEASTSYRSQWVGIEDAPRTYVLTVQGPGNSGKYGLGGSIYNDVTGPTSKSGLYLSYAYHFQVSSTQRVSMGLSGGVMQYKVDGTKLTLFDEDDQVLANARLTALIPDFGFGVYWHEDDKFYLGISTPQFTQSRISMTEDNIKSPSILSIHYFLNGGYTFNLTDDFDVEPSFLMKYVQPSSMQLDVGARMIFRKFIWLGAVFRTQDAVSAIVGFNTPNDQLSFGYSYDFTTTNLSNYSFGTHELMVAAKFGKKKAYASRGKQKRREFEELQQQHEQEELRALDKKEQEQKIAKEQELLKIRIKKLAEKDKQLRDKIRSLRAQAKILGFESPADQGYGRKGEYEKALKEVKDNFTEKRALESQLK